MKLATIIATAALAILAVSAFAQSNQSLTRAEVNDELVQVERAGYTTPRAWTARRIRQRSKLLKPR
ncbi:hypothetical protein AWB67_06505 [Caballeronia terrestris]|uniref:DUF4148 domain-containing protein n=1 Tax=Caballeronia terrestris TaxID=1226301 RepID=A0A158KTP3_9BURK|nr:DUF4148 domain-containing protein [Caballeronia terrestris]SAL83791.1 hypothetical protein AWB67_06505 [Caballeronia terrestris]